MKWPNSRFCGEREHTTVNFLILLPYLNAVPINLVPGYFTHPHCTSWTNWNYREVVQVTRSCIFKWRCRCRCRRRCGSFPEREGRFQWTGRAGTLGTRLPRFHCFSHHLMVFVRLFYCRMIVAIRTRFRTTATDLTKRSESPSLLKNHLMYRDRRANTTVLHLQGKRTVRGVKFTKMSRVLVKLSLWFKTVKWVPWI